MIIGLNGYAKSGKDEVAQFIREINQSFQIKKFSGKLKYIASMLTDIPADRFEDQSFKSRIITGWDMTGREMLQRLGTEAIRNNLHEKAWVNALFADHHQHAKWVITDCRFPNEAQEIKDYGGIIVRVNRTGFGPVNNHPSETALDDYDFDAIIENNGSLNDLKETTRILYDTYINKR
jgi:hypothetical protein